MKRMPDSLNLNKSNLWEQEEGKAAASHRRIWFFVADLE